MSKFGPAKNYPGRAAANSCGVLLNIDLFAEGFFERGAIKAMLLTVKGMPAEAERSKLEEWWRSVVAGIKNAFGAKVINAEAVTPVVIGEGMKELENVTIGQEKREDIAIALGIPMSILFADAANYACLPADQLVYTPHGPVEIAKLKAGDSIWQFNESGTVENKVGAIIPHGKAPIYEITTPTRKLRASDNHLILTVNKIPGTGGPYHKRDANLVWKRADSLVPGDLIISAEEMPTKNKREHNGIDLNDNLMELLGLYLGDGDKDTRTIRFAIPEGPLQDHYASKASQTFERQYKGVGVLEAKKQKYIFSIHSASAVNVLNLLEMNGTSLTKRVPSWIYEIDPSLQLAFLRGYLDSDGTVDKNGRITFASANEELIKDIRVLCVTCGIPVSNINHYYRPDGNFRTSKFISVYLRIF